MPDLTDEIPAESDQQTAVERFTHPDGQPYSKLRIEFDPKKDLRVLDDGAEVLIELENEGPLVIREPRLKIEFIESLTSRPLPKGAKEIRNVTLVPSRPVDDIIAGERIIFRVIRGFNVETVRLDVNRPRLRMKGDIRLKNANRMFLVDAAYAYANFAAGSYKIHLLATGEGAVPDRQALIVKKRKKTGLIAELEPSLNDQPTS